MLYLSQKLLEQKLMQPCAQLISYNNQNMTRYDLFVRYKGSG